MRIELTQPERDLLAQLVDAELREIGPEIRHTRTYTYKDDLKERRKALQHLREHLAAETPNVMISEV